MCHEVLGACARERAGTALLTLFSSLSPVRVREGVQLVLERGQRGFERLGPGFRDVRADRAEAVLMGERGGAWKWRGVDGEG